jgi:ribosomal protein S18 acetylase RimI-like enzyme
VIEVRQVDFDNKQETDILVNLLDCYSRDPMGGGEPLDQSVQNKLASALKSFPTTESFIAYHKEIACGLANCFLGFSTFKGKPLLNIHDLVVTAEYRRQGVGMALLCAIEDYAVQNGCCKLTLEVLQNNLAALNSYTKFGFAHYQLDPEKGSALFMEKSI